MFSSVFLKKANKLIFSSNFFSFYFKRNYWIGAVNRVFFMNYRLNRRHQHRSVSNIHTAANFLPTLHTLAESNHF